MEKEKLLAKIKHDFLKLGIESFDRDIFWREFPRSKILRGKNILMVDSDKKSLAVFVIDLNLVTLGKAFFFEYKHDSKDKLLDVIESEKIDIILVSDKLLSSIDGITLARFLLKQGLKAKIIGLWTHDVYKDMFKRAGTIGSVAKNVGFPNALIADVAELVEEKI